MDEYVLGIDCSTSAVKVIAWNTTGDQCAEARNKTELFSPREGWYEQNPEEWWKATVRSIKKVASMVGKTNIRAICISHQRETFVPVDGKFLPIGNALSYFDTRAVFLLEKLKKLIASQIVDLPIKIVPSQ